VRKSIQLPRQHIEWFRSLPTFHDDGKRFFVHAGVHPARPLDQQDEHDLLRIQEPFLSSQKNFSCPIDGHTPLPNGVPDQRQNPLNIDYRRSLRASAHDGSSHLQVQTCEVSSNYVS
jgi:serine/threonine protein phosphatase 1